MSDNLPPIPPEWDDPPRAERWIAYGHRSDPHKLTLYFYDRPVAEPGGQIVAAVAVSTDLAHASARNIIDRLVDTRATGREGSSFATEVTRDKAAPTSVGDTWIMVGDHNAVTVGDKSRTIGDNRRWSIRRHGLPAAIGAGLAAVCTAILEVLRRESIWPF